MSEWGVVLVVVALVGLVASIAGPIIKLNTAIVTLNVTLKSFEGNFTDMTTKNAQSHDRIWKAQEDAESRLNDHEVRIVLLEKKDGTQ